MRLVFAGTPEFAAVSLRGLHDAGHDVLAVYTQPDRPAGRGRKPRASPVKQLAATLGLAILQPRSLRGDAHSHTLAAYRPEAMIVAAYGLILPPEILRVPARGCINVHASLLPRWRGAAPIQRAILAGDRDTGVSIMKMAEGLDTGPVMSTRACPIGPRETAGTLHDRLAVLGRDALLQTLDRLAAGPVEEVPQDDRHATYAHRIDKAEARIDWHRSAESIERQVRAFNPAPGAWTRMPASDGSDGPRLKVLLARAGPGADGVEPGTVLQATGDRLCIACGDGSLCLLTLQPEGRRPVSTSQFLNARGIGPAERLR